MTEAVDQEEPNKAPLAGSLSLGRWALNPIFLKEILVYERSGSATPTRAAVMSLAVSLLVLLLLSLAVYFPGPWRFAGRGIGLATLALLAFASYAVMIPAATSIALERDRETFDTLTISTLESHELIRGKVLGAFSIGLMTKAAMLPACGLAYLFGGITISLFLAFLCVIASVDFAYATLGVLISCKHHKPPRVQAFIKAPTQAQMALQRGVGLLVVSSVLLLYGVAALIPLAIHNNWLIPRIVHKIAVFGIFHPVLCLVFWGSVDLFGVELPVWVLCSVFHLLVAAPLYANAVQNHRPITVQRSRGPRILSLPLLSFIYLCALGSLWDSNPLFMLSGLSVLVTFFVMAGVIGSAYKKEKLVLAQRNGRLGMLHAAFFKPGELLRNQCSSSPGYLLLKTSFSGLVFGAALFHCYPDQSLWIQALQCFAGLLIFSLGASLFGVQSNARVQLEEGLELQKIIGSETEAKKNGKPSQAKLEKGTKTLPIVILVMSFVLPVIAWMCSEAFKSGALPMSNTAATGIKTLGLMSLAFNPMAALLPVLGDASLCGHGLFQRVISDLGASTMTIYYSHLAIYTSLMLASIIFFPKAPPSKDQLLEALSERNKKANAVDPEQDQQISINTGERGDSSK
jgi:hypothetical protein